MLLPPQDCCESPFCAIIGLSSFHMQILFCLGTGATQKTPSVSPSWHVKGDAYDVLPTESHSSWYAAYTEAPRAPVASKPGASTLLVDWKSDPSIEGPYCTTPSQCPSIASFLETVPRNLDRAPCQ